MEASSDSLEISAAGVCMRHHWPAPIPSVSRQVRCHSPVLKPHTGLGRSDPHDHLAPAARLHGVF